MKVDAGPHPQHPTSTPTLKRSGAGTGGGSYWGCRRGGGVDKRAEGALPFNTDQQQPKHGRRRRRLGGAAAAGAQTGASWDLSETLTWVPKPNSGGSFLGCGSETVQCTGLAAESGVWEQQRRHRKRHRWERLWVAGAGAERSG